jgi:murein tripeptide amidase MpaA
MLVDVHGDEELPYCFIAGMEGIPSWDARKEGLQRSFAEAFKRASPDFQTQYGYPLDAPGEANMTICTNQVGGRQQGGCMCESGQGVGWRGRCC